jgi:hypothetical protein
VDDPAARAAAGPDFPGELPAPAREGTRKNMLRAEALDGERHPEIVVCASSLGCTWSQPSAAASVTLKGVTRSIEVPLAIVRTDDAIAARGTFSIAGGAIADAVGASFEIRAVRQ